MNNFKTYHLLFFATIVFLFQIISNLFKTDAINLYGPASIMTIYAFINSPLTVYQMIMGGIVSTFVSYFIYKIFITISAKINVLLFNLVTFISVLSFMVLFNCVSMAALAYTLMAHVSIQNNKFNYLSSYIISTIVILILCVVLLFINKTFNKYIIKTKNDSTYLQQLEQNLSTI
jgi:hypothetical protein